MYFIFPILKLEIKLALHPVTDAGHSLFPLL